MSKAKSSKPVVAQTRGIFFFLQNSKSRNTRHFISILYQGHANVYIVKTVLFMIDCPFAWEILGNYDEPRVNIYHLSK